MKNKVALIGNGYWGSKIIKYADGVFDLQVVADSKYDKNKIWDDYSISGVIIATPMHTHYDIAKEAILNKKHVFIEKPITMHYDESLELKMLAMENNVKIGVEYTNMFSVGIADMVSVIKSKFERINFIDMKSIHLGRFMGIDVYWLLASHHLSVLSMICDLTKMRYRFNDLIKDSSGICTTGEILCLNNDEVFTRIFVSIEYFLKEFSIDVYMNNSFLRFSPIEEPPLRVVDYKRKHMALPEEMITNEYNYNGDESNNLYFAMKYFDGLIAGKTLSNVDVAIEITKILERRNER